MTDSNEVQIIALANYRLVSRPSQLNSSSSISTLTLTTLKRERENWMMSLNPTPLTEAKKWSLKKKTFKLPRKSNQSWDSWTSNCHEIIRTNNFSAIPSSEPKSQPSSSIKPFWSSIHHSYGFKPLKSIPHFWTKYFILELSCKYWYLKTWSSRL